MPQWLDLLLLQSTLQPQGSSECDEVSPGRLLALDNTQTLAGGFRSFSPHLYPPLFNFLRHLTPSTWQGDAGGLIVAAGLTVPDLSAYFASPMGWPEQRFLIAQVFAKRSATILEAGYSAESGAAGGFESEDNDVRALREGLIDPDAFEALVHRIQERIRSQDDTLAASLLRIARQEDLPAEVRSVALDVLAAARVKRYVNLVATSIRALLHCTDGEIQFSAIAAAGELPLEWRRLLREDVVSLASDSTIDRDVRRAATAYLRVTCENA